MKARRRSKRTFSAGCWFSACALGTALHGCSSDSSLNEPVTPTAFYNTEHFLIADDANASQNIIDTVKARLEYEYDRVGQFLTEFEQGPERLVFQIQPGKGIPFVTPADLSITQWYDDGKLQLEYLPHQITHMWTGYTRRLFLEEGLAVYVTEELVGNGETINPYRQQRPHAWVSLFEQNDSRVSLFTAFRTGGFVYSFRGSESDAVAWQVFLEAGSFTRWVVDTYGRETWFELYATENLGGVLGGHTPEIERLWIGAVLETSPDPLPCDEAIGTITSREEFWCRRAAGR